MTGVPQLPVEASSAKALEKGEMLWGRASKPVEEGGEGGFAAMLAEVLPQRTQGAKAEWAVAPSFFQVEGEGLLVEGEAEGPEVADAKEALPSGKGGEAVADTPDPEAVPVVAPATDGELAAEALAEDGPEEVAAIEKGAQPFVVVAEGAAVEQPVEPERIDAEETPREKHRVHAAERPAQAGELQAVETRPAARLQEGRRTVERPRVELPVPERVAWVPVAAARTEQLPAPQDAPVSTAEAPRTESARTERQLTPQVPGVEAGAEPRRLPEMPYVPKHQPPRVDGAPVLEFRVRRERLTQQARQTPAVADWVRAADRKTAETPTPAVMRQEVAAPAETRMPAVRVEVGPGPTIETPPERNQEAEQKSPARPSMQKVAAAAVVSHAGDAQSVREGSDEAPIERGTQPKFESPSVKRIPTDLAAKSQVDAEGSVEGPLKNPVAPAAPAQPANGLQAAAPANSSPLETRTAQPTEDARPITSAEPPSQPEIAAKLQQQSGRTTLNVVLQDERLGRVALQLVERGGWIETAIRASDPGTAQTFANNAVGLFEVLQQRGLALAGGGGAAAWDAQEGQRRENPERDQDAARRRFRLRRTVGEFEGALARAEG